MYTPCGGVYVRSHVCTCVCMCTINGLNHPLRIFANPLDAYTLYIRQNSQFMSRRTIYVFLVAGDVAQRDTFDRAI